MCGAGKVDKVDDMVQGWVGGPGPDEDKCEKKDGEHDPNGCSRLIRSTPVYTRQLRSQGRASRDAPPPMRSVTSLMCIAQLK
jgi:hypothetical protein